MQRFPLRPPVSAGQYFSMVPSTIKPCLYSFLHISPHSCLISFTHTQVVQHKHKLTCSAALFTLLRRTNPPSLWRITPLKLRFSFLGNKSLMEVKKKTQKGKSYKNGLTLPQNWEYLDITPATFGSRCYLLVYAKKKRS